MFDGALSTSSYVMQREPFADVIDEARPMLENQWAEAGEEGAGAFHLAEDRYIAASKIGALWVITVRHTGELIGYATMFVFTGMHAAAKVVVSDALYLRPDHRRPRLSMRLIQYVENLARADGANLLHWQCNPRFLGFGRVLNAMDYEQTSIVYAKVLSHA